MAGEAVNSFCSLDQCAISKEQNCECKPKVICTHAIELIPSTWGYCYITLVSLTVPAIMGTAAKAGLAGWTRWAMAHPIICGS